MLIIRLKEGKVAKIDKGYQSFYEQPKKGFRMLFSINAIN